MKNGNLTANILDDVFEIDLADTDVDGKVECGKGETQVTFYCGKIVEIHVLLTQSVRVASLIC